MHVWDLFILRCPLASLPALLCILGLTSAGFISLARLSTNIQLGLVTEGPGGRLVSGKERKTRVSPYPYSAAALHLAAFPQQAHHYQVLQVKSTSDFWQRCLFLLTL